MNQNLKQVALFCMAMVCFWTANAQMQTINLSTGISNVNTGNYIDFGVADDTWKVTDPNGVLITPKVCNYPSWAEGGCSRWISPKTFNDHPSITIAGVFTFKANFTVTVPSIDCAKLEIANIGGDNSITGFQINGHSYALNLPAGDHFSTLTNNISLAIDPAHLNAGANTLTITINNTTNYSGLNICAELQILNSNINPEISGPTSVCQGNPLTFTGSLAAGSGIPTHHMWRLVECTSTGVLVQGGFDWEQWFTGTPGAYTFPSNLNLACGKYYMVVLAGVYDSDCPNWAQELKVIYYSCNPTANAGADQTVCEGNCVTIGTTPGKGISYNWTANGAFVANSGVVSVCPEVNTTYTVTATNQYGCTASDQVTVSVLPNNPRFGPSGSDVSNNNYYTVTMTPLVMNANSVPGFGAYWSVEELDANGNSLYIIQNPIQWYPYPASCSFKGFDDYSVNYDVTPNVMDVHTSVPTTPTYGRFLYNHTYRITRGTWNNNCSWNAYAYIMTTVKSANGGDEVYMYETEAPDFNGQYAAMQEETAHTWNIAPNPSKDVFTISSEVMEGSTVEVYDLFGKKIASKVIEAGTTTFPLDLSGNAKGVYVLNITTAGVTSTHKIILE